MKMMKKTISKKIIVSALSTAMGVSLVGAISGTVAWYQYSTRSTVSFLGTSVGTSENLLVSFEENGTYKNDLYLSDNLVQFAPVTSGALAKDAAIVNNFKAQPIYQNFSYDKWIDANDNSYVKFDMFLRLDELDANGQAVAASDLRNVYLTDLTIQNDANNQKNDISNAMRIHIAADHENMLVSKNGGTTDVHGKLDLNNDGRADSAGAAYIFNSAAEPVDYGAGEQTAYKISDVVATPNQNGVITGDHYIGTFNSAKEVTFGQDASFANGVVYYDAEEMATPTADVVPVANKKYYVHRDVLKVTVTIWLEGWQKFDTIRSTKLQAGYNFSTSEVEYFTDANCSTPATGTAVAETNYYFHSMEAIWDPALYVGSVFDIGLMFEVNPNL